MVARVVLVGSLAGVLAACSSEKAGWEDTTWGMTPEQVVAAQPGKANEITAKSNFSVDGNFFFPPADSKVWRQNYELNGKSWVAFFTFDEAGLNGVHLMPWHFVSSTFAEQIKQGLIAKFGEPTVLQDNACARLGSSQLYGEKHKFTWPGNNTNVELDWGSFCDGDISVELDYSRSGARLAGKL